MRCSVCSTEGFTEKAHIKSKSRFQKFENDKIFNILPICPRCHYYFDVCKAFTLHHEWKCWVFSDKANFYSTDEILFDNPFSNFIYAYPPRIHQKKINRIDRELIMENQRKEFVVNNAVSPSIYFSDLEIMLRQIGRWDEHNQRPLGRKITSEMKIINE